MIKWSNQGESDYAFNSTNLSNIGIFRVKVFKVNRTNCKWTKEYHIQNLSIKFKLDTGAEINCIPVSFVRKLKIHVNKENNFKVVDYSSNNVRVHGTVLLECVDINSGTINEALFVVVDDSFEPLLGRDSCESFGLIKRLYNVNKFNNLPDSKLEFLEMYYELFKGVGKFPDKFRITLKEGSVPKLHYKKRIPLSLHDKLKVELQNMLNQAIISRVDTPTDWINNIQIVEKSNGSLRICLDPKALNECIKREHFLIPKSEDLLSRLSGMSVFTVLDLRNGFWQMELDEESSKLTTFMTPFGRFKRNRVPFGITQLLKCFKGGWFKCLWIFKE